MQPLLLAALAITALSTPAVKAQQTQDDARKIYDVEVIIFKNVKVPRSHEINLPVAAPGAGEHSLRLSQIQNAAKPSIKAGFTALGNETLQLLPQAKQIEESGRYDLLLHTGWRQPGLGEAESIPVFIRAGRIYPSTYSSIDQFRDLENATENKSGSNQQTTVSSGSLSTRGLYELEGLITISLSRYLHTNAQLILRKPASTIEILEQSTTDESLVDAEGGILLNHVLDEKRRMRSRKLHYLDHPQFGMLVLITPFEEKEAESAPEENNGETAEAANAPESSG
jgi:hypothetical protein